MDQTERLISTLPDELALKILSAMPTFYAVHTCLVSKTWTSAWRLVNNFDFNDFDHVHPRGKHIWEFVDKVLEGCSTSVIDSFKLRFRKAPYGLNRYSRWIELALMRNACKLDVQHFACVTLPGSLLISRTLTNLKLHAHRLNFPDLDDHSTICLPCLKNLHISSDLDDNAFKLIHGCPVLECLCAEINNCVLAQYYHHYNIPTLKELKLSVDQSETFSNSVSLNLPKLERLDVVGMLCWEFVMEDVSSLNEAKAACWVKDMRLWVQLLNRISKVKSLCLDTGWEGWEDTVNQVVLPEFPNLKILKLKDFDGHEGEMTPQVLKCCPELVNLSIEKVEAVEWDALGPVPNCIERNLKTLSINISQKDQDLVARLVQYMLGNSRALNKVTITCDSTVSKEEEEILLDKFTGYPKASKACEIYVVRN